MRKQNLEQLETTSEDVSLLIYLACQYFSFIKTKISYVNIMHFCINILDITKIKISLIGKIAEVFTLALPQVFQVALHTVNLMASEATQWKCHEATRLINHIPLLENDVVPTLHYVKIMESTHSGRVTHLGFIQ